MSTLWLDSLGSEVRYYDVGGVRTRVIEAGQGEAVIFLHGVGGHAEAFARNVVPFSEQFRAIAMDYLGFGLTAAPAEPPTRDAYVAHLVDFMDVAGIERAHLVGESLGGWVAFWTAILHPERVGKLVSVCGARLAIAMDPESQRHVEEGVAELGRLSRQYAADPSRENVRARLRWLFAHPDSDITEELVDLRLALYRRQEQDKVLKTAQSVLRAGTNDDEGFTPERLAMITQPTLMLWTEHNPSTTAATARDATRYLPNGSFRLMEDCAHWPQWEKPAEFNAIVSDFLRQR